MTVILAYMTWGQGYHIVYNAYNQKLCPDIENRNVVAKGEGAQGRDGLGAQD